MVFGVSFPTPRTLHTSRQACNPTLCDPRHTHCRERHTHDTMNPGGQPPKGTPMDCSIINGILILIGINIQI